MFVIRFLMALLDWPQSLWMPRNRKKRVKRSKLSISAGTLALFAACGLCSQLEASIYFASPLGHLEETLRENPAPKWDLPIPDHPAVDAWVKGFCEKNHRRFQIQLDRARFYAAPAREIFERKGLPKELIYVALIESGFCLHARSRANAVGMWQIVSKTGFRFGLEQNKWVDQRRDPMKAAQAAADYLSLLYDKFGSWSLALAAYNAGENALRGALEKSGLNSFWDLVENGCLPAETRNYVPKVFAAVKIVRDPALYGFRLDSNHFVASRETASVPGGLKLSWVGKLIGVSKQTLQDYNPELCRSTTPPNCSKYELCLPVGTKDHLLTALSGCPRHDGKPACRVAAVPQLSALISCRVKSGDSWFALAERHKCSVTALAALNGMKPSRPLKAGQALKLPAGAPSPSLSKARTKRGIKGAYASDSSGQIFSGAKRKSVHYLVCRGDTLTSISGRFHVPVKTLCALNNVSPNRKLAPGNILEICTSRRVSSQSAKKRVN